MASKDFKLLGIHDLTLKPQIRSQVEDENNTLQDLADSIKAHGILTPLLARPNSTGKYEVVAGERRYRAAQLAGLLEIPTYVVDFSDEEAGDAQLAENVQRKNLTQIEEAKKLQADLRVLNGDKKALAKKHHKSSSWVAKRLALIDLPEQSRRLVDENISADVEVIGSLRRIEEQNPAEAKKLIDKLKQKKNPSTADGQLAIREIVKEVRDKVSPRTKKGEKAGAQIKSNSSPSAVIITPPSEADIDAATTRAAELSNTPKGILSVVYTQVNSGVFTAQEAVGNLDHHQKEMLKQILHQHFEMGTKTTRLTNDIAKILSTSEVGHAALVVALLFGHTKQSFSEAAILQHFEI